MDNIAGTRPALTWADEHICCFPCPVLWLVPTIGLLVSSFRDREQIGISAWWTSPFPSGAKLRNQGKHGCIWSERDGLFIIEGNIFT